MESVCSCVLDNGHLNEHNFHREEIMYIIWSFCKQSIQRYDIFVSEMCSQRPWPTGQFCRLQGKAVAPSLEFWKGECV